MNALTLYRIGWAIAVMVQTGHDAGLAALFSPERYHAPLIAGLEIPAGLFTVLIRVSAWGALCVMLGVGTRIALVAVLLAQGTLFASDLLLFRNHVYLSLLTGTLLACHGRGFDARTLIRIQTIIVYTWAALQKLRPAFLDGWVLQQELPHGLRGGLLAEHAFDASGRLVPVLARMLGNNTLMATCACLVVAAEAFLAVGLPLRRLQTAAFWLGAGLHLTFFVTMGVFSFGCLMLASYPLFRER